MTELVLASASKIRAELLARAGIAVSLLPARIDEEAIRASLEAEGATPRDLADALAEMKAQKVAFKKTGAIVIGCDQVLDFKGQVFGKPATLEEARSQLQILRGQTHKLLSAVVVYEGEKPVWRHVGEVRLTMREFSDDYLQCYLARNGESVLESVGAYKLEEEGVRLFTAVQGDYFTVLGLPLVALTGYLAQRGWIDA